jgi:hypothetical protein
MAVDERSRRELHRQLREAIDMRTADLLVEHLPPLGSEPATKSDIADVRTEIARAVAELRKTIIWLIGSMFAVMMATVVSLVVPLVTLR